MDLSAQHLVTAFASSTSPRLRACDPRGRPSAQSSPNGLSRCKSKRHARERRSISARVNSIDRGRLGSSLAITPAKRSWRTRSTGGRCARTCLRGLRLIGSTVSCRRTRRSSRRRSRATPKPSPRRSRPRRGRRTPPLRTWQDEIVSNYLTGLLLIRRFMCDETEPCATVPLCHASRTARLHLDSHAPSTLADNLTLYLLLS